MGKREENQKLHLWDIDKDLRMTAVRIERTKKKNELFSFLNSKVSLLKKSIQTQEQFTRKIMQDYCSLWLQVSFLTIIIHKNGVH